MSRRGFKLGWLAAVVALGSAAAVGWAQTNASAPAAAREEGDWARRVAQTYQDFLQQQQATLRAIEQARLDADAAAKRNAGETELRLQRIESALETRHARELATLAVVAGVGFFGVLFFAFFVVRLLNRRVDLLSAEVAGGLRQFGAGYTAALGTGETGLVPIDPATQSTGRLVSALEHLEKRIQEMEQAGDAYVSAGESVASPAEAPVPAPPRDEKADRIALLLGKGETLLNLQQADTALGCFEEVIALDPSRPEAFVKKGTALERLGRIDEAIDNYDRAIALDDSLTIAYLCKGGVFNRLERYGEALQCYEQALRTQDKPRLG